MDVFLRLPNGHDGCMRGRRVYGLCGNTRMREHAYQILKITVGVLDAKPVAVFEVLGDLQHISTINFLPLLLFESFAARRWSTKSLHLKTRIHRL